MAELVKQRYAGAFYEVAKELKKEDEFLNEIQFIDSVFNLNSDLLKVLKSPMISNEEKKHMIENIFKGKLSDYSMNFMKILIDKNRISSFNEITKEFKIQLNHSRNIKEVIAVTATELELNLKDSLVKKLELITKSKIELTNIIDKAIIGGILIKIGNEQIDASVKNRLEALKQEISAIIA